MSMILSTTGSALDKNTTDVIGFKISADADDPPLARSHITLYTAKADIALL